jgi:Arc/MetJ-type ribon-helix-helix transcriptional regulator
VRNQGEAWKPSSAAPGENTSSLSPGSRLSADWYTACMTKQVPVRLTAADLAELDRLVAGGAYASRSDALRAGLAVLVREEREQLIEDAYRRGYGEHPQEAWIGAAGLTGLAAFDAGEGGEPL